MVKLGNLNVPKYVSMVKFKKNKPAQVRRMVKFKTIILPKYVCYAVKF
jgi:hypothetical protein